MGSKRGFFIIWPQPQIKYDQITLVLMALFASHFFIKSPPPLSSCVWYAVHAVWRYACLLTRCMFRWCCPCTCSCDLLCMCLWCCPLFPSCCLMLVLQKKKNNYISCYSCLPILTTHRSPPYPLKSISTKLSDMGSCNILRISYKCFVVFCVV